MCGFQPLKCGKGLVRLILFVSCWNWRLMRVNRKRRSRVIVGCAVGTIEDFRCCGIGSRLLNPPNLFGTYSSVMVNDSLWMTAICVCCEVHWAVQCSVSHGSACDMAVLFTQALHCTIQCLIHIFACLTSTYIPPLQNDFPLLDHFLSFRQKPWQK